MFLKYAIIYFQNALLGFLKEIVKRWYFSESSLSTQVGLILAGAGITVPE